MMSSATVSSQPPMLVSLRDELRYETRSEHEALESSLDLMRADFSLPDYCDLLRGYRDFYFAFEAFLDEEGRQDSIPAAFYRADRRKAQWLQQDLRALKRDDGARDASGTGFALAELFPTAAHQLGAIYVIEGSMLGGRILSRHFSVALGLTAERGLRFFRGYGDAAAMRWQATLQLLEEHDPGAGSRIDIITGAKRMFSLLGRHLNARRGA